MRTNDRLGGLLLATGLAAGGSLLSAPLTIVNGGFEDLSGQTVFDEFTFGTPVGWELYDPSGIVPDAGIFVGTLMPNGIEFFAGLAPEGDRVCILYGATRRGEGAYGFEQTLSDVLRPNTRYELRVAVGNIASGTSTNGTFYDLSGFPGYRVDLLAGASVIAQDDNSLAASIPEGEFRTSTLTLTTGADHPGLGLPLGVRVVNLNLIPSDAQDADLEVDFDDVRLSSEPADALFADGFEPGGSRWLVDGSAGAR